VQFVEHFYNFWSKELLNGIGSAHGESVVINYFFSVDGVSEEVMLRACDAMRWCDGAMMKMALQDTDFGPLFPRFF